MIAIGIDPGLIRTGLAIVGCNDGETYDLLDYKLIKPDRHAALINRLSHIRQEINNFLDDNITVDVAGIEQTLTNANAKSSILLAQARGVAMSVLGDRGIKTFELHPISVKRIVARDCMANKRKVMAAVENFMGYNLRLPSHDVYDAIGIAYCAINNHKIVKIA